MRRVLLANCIALLVLAGCTGEQPEAAPSSPGERPPVELPEDRDGEAVDAALLRIDMCAVLGAAAERTGEHVLRAPSPSVCELDSPDAFPASLRVGYLAPEQRLKQPSAVIGGAKAYTDWGGAVCEVSFPVSFTLAVQLFVIDRPCTQAEKLATGVATALAEPVRTSTPARWSACEVLRSIPDTGTDPVGDLDTCTDQASDRGIGFVYPQSFPDSGSRRAKIAGLDVWVSTRKGLESNHCRIEWTPGPTDLVVRVQAGTCAEAEPMVEPVSRTLRGRPTEVQPQQPLLYSPDEPDRGFAGACAFADNLLSPENCAPHVEVPVPAGDDLLRAAEADADVACELAADAITERFGGRMRAVTVRNESLHHCYFVSPERLIQVEFSVSAEPLGEADEDPGRKVDIAGHTGYVASGSTFSSFRVATGDDVDEPGKLLLMVATGPVTGAELTDDAVEKAEQVLADVVREHFGR